MTSHTEYVIKCDVGNPDNSNPGCHLEGSYEESETKAHQTVMGWGWSFHDLPGSAIRLYVCPWCTLWRLKPRG